MWFHIHYLSGYFSGRLLGKKWDLDRSDKIVLILASILPDLDAVFYFIFSGLHDPAPFHGGVTHTLLIGLILGTMLAICAFGFLKLRNREIKNEKLIKFIVLGMFGVVLHLFIDIFTIANEYGAGHHLYFWPISDFSYHFDILFANIFPRYPYFNFEELMFIQYSPISFRIVAIISLIVNGIFLAVLIFEFVPPRKKFPWDVFIYNSNKIRDPWINDNLEVVLNVFFTLIFFGAFLLRINDLLFGILSSL
ncbi:MAG: metal-dependent hydrolase [Candidatus Helarchaeota archaeon]